MVLVENKEMAQALDAGGLLWLDLSSLQQSNDQQVIKEHMARLVHFALDDLMMLGSINKSREAGVKESTGSVRRSRVGPQGKDYERVITNPGNLGERAMIEIEEEEAATLHMSQCSVK